MKINTINLKATDFKYPSKEERVGANNNYPKLTKFGFPYMEGLESIVSTASVNITVEEATRKNNLYWWDEYLQTKLAKLYQSFVNTHTNFSRGIPNDTSKFIKDNHLNKLQFDFYAETFYYFFFSVRDIIAQILNTYYSIGCEEDKVSFKKIKDKLKGTEVQEALNTFYKSTEEASEIRNSFTHRFPATQPNFRLTLEDENGRKILALNGGYHIPPEKVVKNIKESLKNLSILLESLQASIK